MISRLLLGISAISLASCGQVVTSSAKQNPNLPNQNAIITDPGNNSSSGGNGSSGNGGEYGSVLGRYALGVRVNRTIVARSGDAQNHYGYIRTVNGVSGPGAYYGVGLGNTGMIGMGLSLHHAPIASFQSIQFKVFTPSTNSDDAYNAYIGMVIDLNCNDLNPKYLVLKTDDLPAQTLDRWNSYEIKATDAIFRPSGTFGAGKTLKQLTSGYASACFVATDSFDFGFKRDQKIAPIQIIHGDRFYTINSAIAVDDIQLNFSGKTEVEDFE